MVFHRYLVDVDGNAQSNRFPRLLGLGRVVIKASRYRTFLSASQRAGLFPQVVHVSADLSDLVVAVRCLQTHDRQAFARASQGSLAASELLSYRSIIGYWTDLLLDYAKRQAFTPTRHPEARHWLTWRHSW